MKTLFYFLLTVHIINTGYACHCVTKSKIIWNYIFETDIVFTGTIIGIDTLETERILHFKVDRNYKNCENPTIGIITGYGGPDCGLNGVAQNQQWLIFASTRYGYNYSNVCTYSCMSSDINFKKQIKELSILESRETEFNINLTDKQKTARGNILNKKATGKWIIKDNERDLTEHYFYSDSGILDSTHTLKDGSVFVRTIYRKGYKKTRVFENNRMVTMQIQSDTINGEEGSRTYITKYYNENGLIREESELTQFFELPSDYPESYKSSEINYHKNGDIKMIKRRDKEGNVTERFYKKKH